MLIAAAIMQHAPLRNGRVDTIPLHELAFTFGVPDASLDVSIYENPYPNVAGYVRPQIINWDMWAHIELEAWHAGKALDPRTPDRTRAEPPRWRHWRRHAYTVAAAHLVDAHTRGPRGYHPRHRAAARAWTPTLACRLDDPPPAQPPQQPADSAQHEELVRETRRRLAATCTPAHAELVTYRRGISDKSADHLWTHAPAAIGISRRELALWPDIRPRLGCEVDEALLAGHPDRLTTLLRDAIAALDEIAPPTSPQPE